MQICTSEMTKSKTIVAMAVLPAATTMAIGCAPANRGPEYIASAKTPVQVSITDAPSDQVLTASRTLNSMILADTTSRQHPNLNR